MEVRATDMICSMKGIAGSLPPFPNFMVQQNTGVWPSSAPQGVSLCTTKEPVFICSIITYALHLFDADSSVAILLAPPPLAQSPLALHRHPPQNMPQQGLQVEERDGFRYFQYDWSVVGGKPTELSTDDIDAALDDAP